jgi:hypothetical protein
MTTSTMDAPVVLSHAEQNAKGHLETIELWYEVFTWCQGDEDPNALSWAGRTFLNKEMDWAADPDREAVADGICDMVQEDPLEVQVREDWHGIGEDAEAAEYMILITTGGPALRMIGRLQDYEPESVRLQHQDWGTNWTEYFPEQSDDALIWYATQFCWGE